MNITKKLKDRYQDVEDVNIKEIVFKVNSITLFYSEGLCNINNIENFIMDKIKKSMDQDYIIDPDKFMLLERTDVKELSDIDNEIFSGNLIIVQEKNVFSLNMNDVPNRNPEQSVIDITISGPRDSFVESIIINVALIRKRFKHSSLKYKLFTVGERTKTKVGLLYVDDITNPTIVETVTKQIENIEVDGIVSNGQFRNLLRGQKKIHLMPQLTYTSRPDYCVSSLLEGKFVILVDNFDNANIGPITIPFLTEFSDETNDHFLVTFFYRIIYFICLFIALFLMGFVLTVYAFDPETMPFVLLSNVVANRKGIILPVHLEIFIATLLFEIFRIAGTRLPAGLSSTLLVIGGALLGQNITSSGLIGYDIIFFSALSIICNYSISNNLTFNNIIATLKIVNFIASLWFGTFGFICSFILIIIYFATLESYGISMLYPIGSLDFKGILNMFVSRSLVVSKSRAEYNKVIDKEQAK